LCKTSRPVFRLVHIHAHHFHFFARVLFAFAQHLLWASAAAAARLGEEDTRRVRTSPQRAATQQPSARSHAVAVVVVFVAVVSAPSSLRVERHPHGLFREPRVGRQPELHRVPTRRRDTRRRRVGRYRCAGDDPAVGLYKLNAADPSLERRLVSTIVPIK
jgi:hypothetical protein